MSPAKNILIMKNVGLDKLQARIKTGGRNSNNLIYVGATTLKAESEEELNSLLRRVKEESERAGLKLNIKKSKIMASGPTIHGKQRGEMWK